MHGIGTLRWFHVAGVGALAIGAAATIEWTYAKSPHDKQHGYLEAQIGQLAARIPPPPGGASVVEADRRVFDSTRSLEGSSRWRQAARDADQTPKSLLRTFSCAAGAELTAERLPHLTALLASAGSDSSDVASRAKTSFMRARPYTLYAGPTCPKPDNLGAKHDYPSGHSARGWTWALILAGLLPDRKAQLMSRAQAYAESRVVCGFHSPTGAAAGRAVAMITVNSLKGNPRFKTDLQRASQELAALKQRGERPPARQCQVEGQMMNRPY
jgi:acid phosphatase (class A)